MSNEIWENVPGTPDIRAIPNGHQAYDIALVIDGGYPHPLDAAASADFWLEQLTKAGIPARRGKDHRDAVPSFRAASPVERVSSGSEDGADCTNIAQTAVSSQVTGLSVVTQTTVQGAES